MEVSVIVSKVCHVKCKQNVIALWTHSPKVGPGLFCFYMLPVGSIIRKYRISFHFYADDSQLYLPLKSNDSLQPHLDCLEDIKYRQRIIFPSSIVTRLKLSSLAHLNLLTHLLENQVTQLALLVKSHVKNLGLIIVSYLRRDRPFSSVVKNGFRQLRIIETLKSILFRHDLAKVIYTFIASHLNYSSALYLGLPQRLLLRLQMVQNAALRLLTGTSKREHIPPISASLHRLPVQFWVQF